MEPININFEHKLLFRDIGPATQEKWAPACTERAESEFFGATLGKLERRLAEEGYVGYIDVNCIVNGNGIYPLELCCFGYPTITIQTDGLAMPVHEFLYGMANGELRKPRRPNAAFRLATNRCSTISV